VETHRQRRVVEEGWLSGVPRVLPVTGFAGKESIPSKMILGLDSGNDNGHGAPLEPILSAYHVRPGSRRQKFNTCPPAGGAWCALLVPNTDGTKLKAKGRKPSLKVPKNEVAENPKILGGKGDTVPPVLEHGPRSPLR